MLSGCARGRVLTRLSQIDAITMEELDVLDAVPHYCPISSHYQWNLDGAELRRRPDRLPAIPYLLRTYVRT